MTLTPEQRARQRIDAALEEAGWVVQDRSAMNLAAGTGVAVREFPLAPGHGFADYLLFVDGKAVGVLEAKKAGHTLSSVKPQVDRYSAGLPAGLNPPVDPLPFLYTSTGEETRFVNLLDPKPRSRRISANLPHIHRPETLQEWINAPTLDAWVKTLHAEGTGSYTASDDSQPSSLRGRLTTLPPLERGKLRQNQFEAITNLETSLRRNHRRALIQMATGSGKTRMAAAEVYRLVKYAGARRVLFLVDRTNLAEQAEDEFKGYVVPEVQRKFSDLYNVERLTTGSIGASDRVVISTIQRVYSMLKGEPLEPEEDERSQFETTFETGGAASDEPLPVVYNPEYPPEFFDFVIIDEAHRSIYSLWRQVVEYFDAFLIGLTATPSKQSFGFFEQNLVMEYDHDRAVTDGVNVDFEVYDIRTRITEEGSTVEAGPHVQLGYRDRQDRTTRWQRPDEDFSYDPNELDRRVVAKDQIRTILSTFRDRWQTDMFPQRKTLPKTLVFAKDDSHAEDVTEIARKVFGEGDDFCQKITYKVSGAKPKDLIAAFRNDFNPRIAVTVDMVATGTDIKPVEIVIFLRAVKSRILFEQMKGRGVRIIDPNELQAVSGPDAQRKTHFVLVDCVGMSDTDLADTQPLERKRTVSFKALLEHVAMGGTDPDTLSSLAGRLSRLAARCGPEEHRRIEEESGGVGLRDVGRAIVDGLDPDRQRREARQHFDLAPGEEPSEEQIAETGEALLKRATAPLATNPGLRELVRNIKKETEQVIDEVSRDEVTTAGFSKEARAQQLRMVQDFRTFLDDNREEIEALRFFYSVPYSQRLSYADVRELAEAIQAKRPDLTPERLWRAYESLAASQVRGASKKRLLTDVVSLVRFALDQDDELVPFGDRVRERFAGWMARQEAGERFTDEQRRWLEMMRDHVATSVEMTVDDLDYAPFAEEGGLGRAVQVFGEAGALREVLEELNEVLAA